jgi:hypothetical protein
MSAAGEVSSPEGVRRRLLLWLAATGVILLHVGLTQQFLPLSLVLGPEPIQGDDFDTHIGQTFRVLEGLQGWGKSWVYDPKLLAGQPEGTIFDADNKAWELWTFAWVSLGASRALAFNSFVLATFLAWPGLAFLGARLLGFSAGAGILAALFSSLVWFFDSFAHWVWWIGMVEYAAGVCFSVVPLGLFYRFVRDPGLGRAAATAVALGAALIVHPYAFFILVVPMGWLYLGSARRFSRREHLAVAGIVAGSIAINLYWLLPAFAHWHYVLDSGYFAQAGPAFLIADFFDLLRDPTDTGVIGTRTGFRFLFLALSLAALVCWRRERDLRFVPFAGVLGLCFLLSYFSQIIPHAAQIQPYRHALPLAYFAAIGAAGFVEHAISRRVLVGLARPVLALLAVLGFGVLQHLAIQVAYFMPHWVPEAKPLFDGSPSVVMRYGFQSNFERHTHMFYGLQNARTPETDIVRWVEKRLPHGTRLLVDRMALGERLAWKTHAEVLGGFEYRNIAHSYANFFRSYQKISVDELKLAYYLRTFAVSYVIAERPRKDFTRAKRLLEPLFEVGSIQVYRTTLPISKLLQGGREGAAVHASTNRIAVSGSDPTQDVVLSYHWHEQLACLPRCRVVREPLLLDPVGFIRVPAPHPASFVIRLQY